MKLPPCRASEPDKCRYHGTMKKQFTELAKTKMLIAQSAYDSLQSSKKYNAYVTLREAQINYYSTVEGLQELNNKINSAPDSVNRQLLKTLHRHAFTKHLQEQNNQITQLKPALLKPLPPSNGTANNLSIFKTEETTEHRIDFNYETEEIVYTQRTTTETNQETIGLAVTLLEATIKATQWYNQNYKNF